MRITNKVAKWIIIIYTIIVSVIIFSLPANAKEFSDLSEKAKKDYITNLTEQISKDLGLTKTEALIINQKNTLRHGNSINRTAC